MLRRTALVFLVAVLPATAWAPATARPSRRAALRAEQDSGGEDMIERLWSFFLGPKEDEPGGFGRMSVDRWPDQYPAEYTRRAAPVETDSGDMEGVRPLLAQTELESRALRCAYDANVDGWSASAFHAGVDKQGPGIVLARTAGGAVCGGYNPKGWAGYGEYRPGLSAFLYTWPDGQCDESAPMTKLRKVGGAGMAQIDQPENGPSFGADGLTVPLRTDSNTQRDNPRIARSKLGAYYERRSDGERTIFAPEEGMTAILEDLKVYVGVYAEGEEVPFNDAMPVSLT